MDSIEIDPAQIEEVVYQVLGLSLAYDEMPDWVVALATRIAQALPQDAECTE